MAELEEMSEIDRQVMLVENPDLGKVWNSIKKGVKNGVKDGVKKIGQGLKEYQDNCVKNQ